MLCDELNWRTVKDMYDYTKENNLKLLSNYSSTFWSDYLANYDKYDKMFMKLYMSYRYYIQNPYMENTIDDVTDDFIDTVYMYLMVNDKRFNELYKIKVLDDTDISLLTDYKLTEIMDGTKMYAGTLTDGSRSDSTSDTLGSRTDTTTQQIEGFNSSDFSDSNKDTKVSGSQSNSGSYTKGQQINTYNKGEDNDYTLTKEGYTGNPYDNVIKFQKVWTNFEFMSYIFREISKEFLLI